MQVITGEDSNGKIRVVDNLDMSVSYITSDELRYYRSLGIKFKKDRFADKWYDLYKFLVKHSLVYAKDTPESYNDFVYIENCLRMISDRFKKFKIPVRVQSIKIMTINNGIILNVNNYFLYLISSKCCRFIYRLKDNSFVREAVDLDDTFFLVRLYNFSEGVPTVLKYDNLGNLIEESEMDLFS